jgi:hypothetical protein
MEMAATSKERPLVAVAGDVTVHWMFPDRERILAAQ